MNCSQSFYSFIQADPSKISTVLYRLMNKRTKLIHTKEIDYLTFRSDGTISYLPAGKEHQVNDSGTWCRDGRQNGKAAKVIRKIFHPKMLTYFSPKDFENFSNKYKAYFSEAGKFELVPGTKATEIYNMNRIDSGCIGNSCMNGKDYFEIYEKCKDLQILTLTNNGLLIGRALVWTIGDKTIMDRIYVSSDYMFELFIEFATASEWYYKEDYKSYQSPQNFIYKDERVRLNLQVFTNTNCEYYPYMDTFRHGGDGYICNYDDQYDYTETDGTRGGDSMTYDDIDECDIDNDDAFLITAGDYQGQTTHRDNIAEVDGEFYYNEDDNIVEVDGDWYRTDSDDICQVDGDWYMMDDCVYVDSMGEMCLTNDCYLVNGEYYHESQVEKC